MATHATHDSILPSVAFWLCLFLAAALFGAVVLVPKILVAERLAQRHREIESRIDWMQRRNAYLDQVVDAFQNDPEFAAEVARFDLGARSPDEHRVEAEARLAFRLAPPAPPAAVPASMPWWITLLEPFARDEMVRDAALLTAAGLLIAGFAFFPVRHDVEM